MRSGLCQEVWIFSQKTCRRRKVLSCKRRIKSVCKNIRTEQRHTILTLRVTHEHTTRNVVSNKLWDVLYFYVWYVSTQNATWTVRCQNVTSSWLMLASKRCDAAMREWFKQPWDFIPQSILLYVEAHWVSNNHK